MIGSMTASYNAATGTVTFTTTGLETAANFVNVGLPAAVGGDDAFNFGFSARVGGANMDLFIDNLVITTIPEPSGLALLGLGALGFFLRRRC